MIIKPYNDGSFVKAPRLEVLDQLTEIYNSFCDTDDERKRIKKAILDVASLANTLSVKVDSVRAWHDILNKEKQSEENI